MDIEQIIFKLKESLEKDYGDYGRTQYIIEKLQKDAQLPKSDYLYIDRMIKLCEPVIEVFEDKKTVENSLSKDLIKCYHCEMEIKLDSKSIRKNNFWFHDKCFEKIPIIKTTHEQKMEKTPNIVNQPIKSVKSKTSYPQMIFTGGLLVSLVGTTYFLAGEVITAVVGSCGVLLFLATFRPQIRTKKKERTNIVKTGIPGFDSSLSTGFKKNSSILISGPPGSGKTTFGLQYIYSGAKEFDEPGVYLSLAQNIEEIKSDCKSFGWDIEKLIRNGKILMLDLRPFKIKEKTIERDDSLYRGEQIAFEHLTEFILNSIKKINAKRVVIDSISILQMQYTDEFYMRQGLQGMLQALENFGVTSLLLAETSEKEKTPFEGFATSGIIQLNNQITNNEIKRTIKIIKLRGIEHSQHIHTLELSDDGLHIH